MKVKHLNGDFLLLPTANINEEDLLFFFKHKKKKTLTLEDFTKNFVNCSKDKIELLLKQMVEKTSIIDVENGLKFSLI